MNENDAIQADQMECNLAQNYAHNNNRFEVCYAAIYKTIAFRL